MDGEKKKSIKLDIKDIKNNMDKPVDKSGELNKDQITKPKSALYDPTARASKKGKSVGWKLKNNIQINQTAEKGSTNQDLKEMEAEEAVIMKNYTGENNFEDLRNIVFGLKELVLLNWNLSGDERIIKVEAANPKMKEISTLYINYCKLTDVVVSLKGLREIDLSYNDLTEIPAFGYCTNLVYVNLSHNKITSIDKGRFSDYLTHVTELDISYNNIQVSTFVQLEQAFKEMTCFEAIEQFDFRENPICNAFPELYKMVRRKVSKTLKSLNGEKITPEIIESDAKEPIRQLQQYYNMKKPPKQLKKGNQKTLLDQIINNLEAASTNPIRCVEYITMVTSAINEIVGMTHSQWEEIFDIEGDEKVKKDLEDKIHSFLENCLVLIENQHSVQNNLMNSLAHLSIITVNGFGKKCLSLLGDLMKEGSSKELKKSVRQKIQVVVVNQLTKFKTIDDKGFPRDILEVLSQIIDPESDGEIFVDVAHKFAAWLEQMVNPKRKGYDEDNSRKNEERVLELLANFTENEEIAKELQSMGAIESISDIFVNISLDKDVIQAPENNIEKFNIYYYSLTIIENIGRHQDEYAIEFITPKKKPNSVLNSIQYEIKRLYEIYKLMEFRFDDGTSQFEKKVKYLQFAALIKSYGVLAKVVSDDKLNDFMKKENIENLLTIASIDDIDPVLLTSILVFSLSIFENTAVSTNHVNFSRVFESIGRLDKCLGYCQPDNQKYQILCKKAMIYEPGSMVGTQAINLQNNTSSIVHNFLISVINVMAHICKTAVSNAAPQAVQRKSIDFASFLDGRGREKILFTCLDVPNDNVKLAVAKCLDKVPVEEIQSEELTYFSTILGNYKNLGAGKTEEVLSRLFMILTKVLEVTTPAAKEFISKYAQNAISDIFDILSRNMSRNLAEDPDENEEKVCLSLACIHFLKQASKFASLRSYFIDLSCLESMKRSLYCEELYMSDYPVPMDIENTYIGRNLEYLFRCLAGNETLTPNSLITYRVIARISDLLVGKKEDEPPKVLDGDIAAQTLKEDTVDYFIKKLKQEIQNWESNEPEVRKGFKEAKANPHELDSLKQQHKLMSSFDGLNRLITFVTRDHEKYKTMDPDIDKFEKLVLSESSRKYEKDLHRYYIKLRSFQEKQETQTFETKKEKPFNEKLQLELQRHDNSKMKDKIDLSRVFLEPPMNPKEATEELEAQTTDSSHPLDGILTHLSWPKKIRVLIVCATLRAAYSTLDFNLDDRLKAIRQLKTLQIIRPLTKLCMIAGWNNGNIASKYLHIMNSVLEEKSVGHEMAIDDKISILEIYARAINDILGKIQSKLQNPERNPLNTDDLILLRKIALGCSLISSEAVTMRLIKSQTVFERPSIVHHIEKLEKTPHEKAAENLLSKLIPGNLVYSLLDVVFINMNKYSNPKSITSDMKTYLLAQLATQAITILLSEYLNVCDSSKYNILKYFCDVNLRFFFYLKAEIFQQKIIRQTYLKDLLLNSEKISYRNALQHYSAQNKKIEEGEFFLDLYMVEVLEEGKKTWNKRILAVTTGNLYFFIEAQNICSICPREKFCPEGPTLESKLPFSEIEYCLDYHITDKYAFGLKSNKESTGIDKIFDMISSSKDKTRKIVMTFIKSGEKVKFLNNLNKNKVDPIFRIDACFALGLYELPKTKSEDAQDGGAPAGGKQQEEEEEEEEEDEDGEKKNLEPQIKKKEPELVIEQSPCFPCKIYYSGGAKAGIHDIFEEKNLVMLRAETLEIYDEYPQYWHIEPKDNKDEFIERVNGGKFKPMYKLKKKFAISSIKEVSFENSDVPISEISFGSETMKFLFSDDSRREAFKVELFKKVGDDFSKTEVPFTELL